MLIFILLWHCSVVRVASPPPLAAGPGEHGRVSVPHAARHPAPGGYDPRWHPHAAWQQPLSRLLPWHQLQVQVVGHLHHEWAIHLLCHWGTEDTGWRYAINLMGHWCVNCTWNIQTWKQFTSFRTAFLWYNSCWHVDILYNNIKVFIVPSTSFVVHTRL